MEPPRTEEHHHHLAERLAARPGLVKQLSFGLAGGLILIVGIALLVLPGPGLLLILGGLLLLAEAFPAVERYVDPVAERAMQAAEESVASPIRVAGSVLAGLCLIGAGIAWGLRVFPWLPLPGWSTGSSLIISGIILFALLGYSIRRFRKHHPTH
ncbi:PGPGW domain-containing protein [Pseudonocardia sp.]|uniref:PGPGW domain-containing protein n=1 Tax=Pseudonocardia sp. TaxID=60912 RepID=UPI003D0D8658